MNASGISNPHGLGRELAEDEFRWFRRRVAELAVYQALRRGQCSIRALEGETGYGKAKIERCITSLECQHVIDVERGRQSRTYVLNPMSHWVKHRTGMAWLGQGQDNIIAHEGEMPASHGEFQALKSRCENDKRLGRAYWALWKQDENDLYRPQEVAAIGQLRSADDVTALIGRLEAAELVSVIPEKKAVVVMNPGSTGGVGFDEDLDEWIRYTRDVELSMDTAHLKKANERRLFWDFCQALIGARVQYYQNLRARQPQGRGVARLAPRGTTGNEVAEKEAIKRLLRRYTLRELQPYLTVYMLWYESENTQKYGKTILTFEKNLEAICDEVAGDKTLQHWKEDLRAFGLSAWLPSETDVAGEHYE